MDEPAHIHIVFDGPPSPDGPRFVEIENDQGESIRVGEWEPDPRPEYDGFWRLKISLTDMIAEAHRQQENRNFTKPIEE